MRSLRALIFIFALLSGGIAASAQEKAVSLPLALYSLPELARALSTDGRNVVCPSSFGHRTALVRLDNLAWGRARDAFQAAFGVRFRQPEGKPDTWLMEPDPQVEARHDRWLARLAELTLEAAKESVLDYRDLAQLSFEDAVRAYIRADEDRRRLELIDPEMEKEETQAAEIRAETTRAFTDVPVYFGTRWVRSLRAADILAAMKAVQRFQPAAGDDLRRSPAQRQLMQHTVEEIRRDQAEAPPEDRPAYDGAIQRIEQMMSQPWSMAARLDFDPTSGAIRGQVVSQSGNLAQEATGFYADPVQDRWLETLPKLGTDAAKWLERDNEERNRLLKEPVATLKLKREPGSSPQSLDQWMETWSAQTGSQVVMELQPGRESIPSRDATDFLGAQPLPESAAERQPEPDTLAAILADSEPGGNWSVQRLGGVWVLVDRMAFVDRLRDQPTSALIALERTLLEDKRSPLVYPFARLATFHQQISAEQSAALGSLVHYRSLDLTLLATCRPAIQVLAAAGSSQRALSRDSLAAGKPFTVALAKLSSNSLSSIAASMRGMALSTRGFAVPDSALSGNPAQDLRRYSLLLRPGSNEQRSVIAAFILSNPGPDDVATDLLEVEIPGLFGP